MVQLLDINNKEAIWYNDVTGEFSWGFGGSFNRFADKITIGDGVVPGVSSSLRISGSKGIELDGTGAKYIRSMDTGILNGFFGDNGAGIMIFESNIADVDIDGETGVDFLVSDVLAGRFDADLEFGIGTDAPAAKLHVVGDAIITGNQYMFASGTSNPAIMPIAHSPTYPTWGLEYLDATDAFNFRSGTSEVLHIGLASKRVGINTTTPTYEFEVAGDIGLSGTIYGTSDIRVKKNVSPIENAVETLQALNPVGYEFKTVEFSEKNLSEGDHFGLLAQEVEAVIPSLVNTADDKMGTKAVNYTELTPFLIKAVQELKTEIEALKKKRLIH